MIGAKSCCVLPPAPPSLYPGLLGFLSHQPVNLEKYILKPSKISAFTAIFLAAHMMAMAEEVDLEVVHLIKQEAFLRSQVMDYMQYAG